jgi:hypothetical protein
VVRTLRESVQFTFRSSITWTLVVYFFQPVGSSNYCSMLLHEAFFTLSQTVRNDSTFLSQRYSTDVVFMQSVCFAVRTHAP